MSKPINVAIFGVGRWGIHLLRNFLAHPAAQVVAVVDPHPNHLTQAAQKFELDHVFLATDWQTIMAMTTLDAVVIATPATTHHLLITQALKQGLHVLAEKPLTLDLATSLQLCQLAEHQQRQLVIDHTYLFHPAVLQGKQLLQTTGLGDLRYGYATRTHLSPVRQDVDALWDLAIHDIAIFNYWLGQTPCRVQATGQGWLQSTATAEFPQGLADTVWVTLIYPSGIQVTVHLCWLNPDKQRRMGLVGSQGTLIFDELMDSPLTVQWGTLAQQDRIFVPGQQSRQVVELPPDEPLKQVCDHFLSCVQANQPSDISSGWLGAELVQILAAASESMRHGGRPIELAPLRSDC
jgi:predicted dehydrogenase